MKKKLPHILTIVNIVFIVLLLLGSGMILWFSMSGTEGVFGWQVYLPQEEGTVLSHAAVLTYQEEEYLVGDTVLISTSDGIKSAQITQMERQQVSLTVTESGETMAVPYETILGRAVFYSLPLGKGILFLSNHTLAAGIGLFVLSALVIVLAVLGRLRTARTSGAGGIDNVQIVEEQLPRVIEGGRPNDQYELVKATGESNSSVSQEAANLIRETLAQIPIEREDQAQLFGKKAGREETASLSKENPGDFGESDLEITMSDEELEQLKKQVLLEISEEERNEQK